jgi:hypothetical protein
VVTAIASKEAETVADAIYRDRFSKFGILAQIHTDDANFDKNTMAHKFKIGNKVLISNDFYTGKNPKLAPQFKGHGEIIDINDTNAKVKINNKM